MYNLLDRIHDLSVSCFDHGKLLVNRFKILTTPKCDVRNKIFISMLRISNENITTSCVTVLRYCANFFAFLR